VAAGGDLDADDRDDADDAGCDERHGLGLGHGLLLRAGDPPDGRVTVVTDVLVS
jgi:hypothetical protein